MKTTLFACLLAVTAFSGIAHADDDKCGNVPMDKWMTQDAVKARATEMGLDVRKVKIEDGCYEVYGIKDGQKIEALFNPETGAQVGIDGDD